MQYLVLEIASKYSIENNHIFNQKVWEYIVSVWSFDFFLIFEIIKKKSAEDILSPIF